MTQKKKGRPQKKGLDWYRHYVDMSQDDKIEYVESEYDLAGYAIWNKLLEKVYANGYCLPWNSKYLSVFAAKVRRTPELVASIIDLFFEEGLFSRGMYEKYGILTSKWIQQNFMDAKERSTHNEIKPEHDLLTENYSDNKSDPEVFSATEIPGDGELLQQECDRVEESRVEESNNVYVAPEPEKRGYKIPDEEPPDTGIRDETEFRAKVLAYWRRNNYNLLPPHLELLFRELWEKYGSHKLLWSMKQFKLGGHRDYKLIGYALDPKNKFRYDYKQQQFANPSSTGGNSIKAGATAYKPLTAERQAEIARHYSLQEHRVNERGGSPGCDVSTDHTPGQGQVP